METSDNLDSLYPFPDNIIIQDRLSAIQYACNIFEQGMIERCLLFGLIDPWENILPLKMRTGLLPLQLDISTGWGKALLVGAHVTSKARFFTSIENHSPVADTGLPFTNMSEIEVQLFHSKLQVPNIVTLGLFIIHYITGSIRGGN